MRVGLTMFNNIFWASVEHGLEKAVESAVEDAVDQSALFVHRIMNEIYI